MLLGEKDRAKWKRQEMSGKRDGERVSLSLKEKERGRERGREGERRGEERCSQCTLSSVFPSFRLYFFPVSNLSSWKGKKQRRRNWTWVLTSITGWRWSRCRSRSMSLSLNEPGLELKGPGLQVKGWAHPVAIFKQFDRAFFGDQAWLTKTTNCDWLHFKSSLA